MLSLKYRPIIDPEHSAYEKNQFFPYIFWKNAGNKGEKIDGH